MNTQAFMPSSSAILLSLRLEIRWGFLRLVDDPARDPNIEPTGDTAMNRQEPNKSTQPLPWLVDALQQAADFDQLGEWFSGETFRSAWAEGTKVCVQYQLDDQSRTVSIEWSDPDLEDGEKMMELIEALTADVDAQ
ncbi:MAG: hypothetical protein AAF938_25900 [Myxococcota bacterium]